MTQDYGATTRSAKEQWLEPKNIETAIALTGTNLIWKLYSTRPAIYTLTQSGLAIPSPERQISGMEYTLALFQNSTGGYNVTWGTCFIWDSGEEPVMNNSPGALNLYKFFTDGTYMYGRLAFKS